MLYYVVGYNMYAFRHCVFKYELWRWFNLRTFSRWLKSTEKFPNRPPIHYLFVFGRYVEIEKLSEIKPPLNISCGTSD